MSHRIILEEHPGETVPELSVCPQCRLNTPMIIIARATSEKHGVYHYHLCGCEHAHELGDWSFPPSGMSTSRRKLAEAWNQHVNTFKL
jgi:hypothetical protein